MTHGASSAPQFFQRSSLITVPLRPDMTAQFVAGERLMALFGRVEPGVTLGLHRHPNEQFTYVLEGMVHYEVGEEGRDLVAGEGVLIPGGVVHGAVRFGPEGCTVLEVCTPPREEFLPLMEEKE
jgi:quercetin dioxygenase-like cupin family protein